MKHVILTLYLFEPGVAQKEWRPDPKETNHIIKNHFYKKQSPMFTVLKEFMF